ncbi:MAG: DinB family protein [Intrasporangium sp.]|uniref:DinB family protein n=1 Tax=Intrasporangium sp. TaxID=1925024 RepID=UPI00264977E9|nr:DinB family protein [Intrasporangium sp.]MDN5797234.1 DinB family protein [Intrasporangium sp.]
MGRVFEADDLRGARFVDVDLTTAEFREVTLNDARFVGVVAHDVEVEGLISNLRVNGVEVMQFVEAELDRRHPERLLIRSADLVSLRKGWEALTDLWAATTDRIAALPVRDQNRRVDGEWSAVETLRHLVFVTDAWFRRGVLGVEKPYHPIGLAPHFVKNQHEMGLDPEAHPTLEEVRVVRAAQATEILAYLFEATDEALEEPGARTSEPGWPSDPSDETVLGCLQVLLDEEWAHHQFCVRDLARLG